jgi:hypothetical protein
MKRTLITLGAGIATGGAVVAAPALSSPSSSRHTRYVTLRTGDFVSIPEGHLTGPIIFCAA